MKLKYSFMVLLIFGNLQARYHEVKSTTQLQHLIDQYAYSLVCFAPSKLSKDAISDKDDQQEIKSEFKELKYMVRSASRQNNYKELLRQDIGFVVADAAASKIQEEVSNYQISEMPMCVVFDHGAQDGKKTMIKPASVKDLLKALESVGSTKLQDLLHQRQEDAALQRQERIAAYYAYGATYPYWGAPYWTYGYGGWGPYGRAGWCW